MILQCNIQQWDKSQRTTSDAAARASQPNHHRITSKPEFFIFDRPCILDLHLPDAARRPIKKFKLNDRIVKIDRFIISRMSADDYPNAEGESEGDSGNEEPLILSYQADDQTEIALGDLNRGWIQATYNWRYAVEQDRQIYWLYETFTLNAVCIENYDFDNNADYFINTPSSIQFTR